MLDRNVHDCGYLASIGTRDTSLAANGLISVARDDDTSTVTVVTRDAGGTPAPRPFHLLVRC